MPLSSVFVTNLLETALKQDALDPRCSSNGLDSIAKNTTDWLINRRAPPPRGQFLRFHLSSERVRHLPYNIPYKIRNRHHFSSVFALRWVATQVAARRPNALFQLRLRRSQRLHMVVETMDPTRMTALRVQKLRHPLLQISAMESISTTRKELARELGTQGHKRGKTTRSRRRRTTAKTGVVVESQAKTRTAVKLYGSQAERVGVAGLKSLHLVRPGPSL
ncbi:hypothetical protein B0T09DRAFT_112688 [Sordaria sp. MPI-SDFR-AT-0083]|nr:hypothetical protein B0T09DRAFT_112688 [Sordaria sp. MPI-SDFR-AT-0083]